MLGCLRGKSEDKSLAADDISEDFSVETRNFAPKHLLIKIDSFSSLSRNGIDKYESREFVAGDHKWKLTIYPDVEHRIHHHVKPNYTRSFSANRVSVYLSPADTCSLPVDWEINAIFTVFLFNHIQDNYVCYKGTKIWRFHAMNPKWGFSKFISTQSLTEPSKGYLVGDKLVIGAEVFVYKSPPVIERVSFLRGPPSYTRTLVVSNLSSKLESGWNSEEFPAGDYFWKVHLYPNGCESGKGRGVSLFIEHVDCKRYAPQEKVMARISMDIKRRTGISSYPNAFTEWFSSTTKSSVGFPELMPIGDLQDPEKGYVVDDSCSIEIEIEILAQVCDAPS